MWCGTYYPYMSTHYHLSPQNVTEAFDLSSQSQDVFVRDIKTCALFILCNEIHHSELIVEKGKGKWKVKMTRQTSKFSPSNPVPLSPCPPLYSQDESFRWASGSKASHRSRQRRWEKATPTCYITAIDKWLTCMKRGMQETQCSFIGRRSITVRRKKLANI